MVILIISVLTAGFSSYLDIRIDNSVRTRQLITPCQIVSSIEITSNAELAEDSSSGVGTRNDPYIIENKVIDSLDCVRISNTNAFFIIRNSRFSNGLYDNPGIVIIDFVNVEHGKIENCYIHGGEVGVSFRAVRDCHVNNCMIYDAYDGVLIDNSENSTIANSKSFGNTIGMMITNAQHCDIINNSIYSNSERGIYIEAFSENITIAGNNIGWNTNANLLDNGISTSFEKGFTFGNAWSDCNESEDYRIQGSGNTTDYFAELLLDATRPTLSGPPDTIVDIESDGETITWTAADKYHHQYQLSTEGGRIDGGIWNGDPIVFDLSTLDVGNYVLTLTVSDGAGNVASDVVTVSVISFILGGIGTELVLLASGVTVVCFLIVILIIKKIP
jgi:parallel beta-helix repeat protein